MKFELKHCQTFKEAEDLAGNGWDLVSVLPGAGFYFKREKLWDPSQDAIDSMRKAGDEAVEKAILEDYRKRGRKRKS